MNLSGLLDNRQAAFAKLCQEHKVDKLYAFGSSVTSRFNPSKSDVDLVVELNIQDPIQYGETLLSFWDALEILFERKVDLLTPESISNPYLKKEIEATRHLIYDGLEVLTARTRFD